jgi:hypothetical protein
VVAVSFAFLLDVPREGTERLVAVAPGWQPAVVVPERGPSGEPAWPSRVVLQLGDAPLSVSGTVTFADGRPAMGARVWIADPLYVGVEDDVVLAENALLGEDRPFWAFVLTDDQGRFRIDGLATARTSCARSTRGRCARRHSRGWPPAAATPSCAWAAR